MAYLFIDAQHGLCNRLRTMASAASIAARTGRELVVIWRADAHCECHLSDLLDYAGPVIDDAASADLARARAVQVYNYMEIEEGAQFQEPILEDAAAAAGRDIYVRAAYTLTSPHRRHEDEQAFLRRQVPTRAVRDLVAGVRRPNQVAAHIRMGTGPGFDHLQFEAPDNWPAHRHAELIAARRTSHADRFRVRLDALIEQGRADTIFLAADLEATYDDFARTYGDRLAVLRRDRFDRSARQLQYALADLLLLTTAGRYLASANSSFSDMAQRLAPPGRVMERAGENF